MSRTTLLNCSFAAALFASACGGAKQESAATPGPTPVADASASPGTPAASGVSTPEASLPSVGTKAKCPVSGEDFVVSDSSPKAEYEGKTYYFCCPSCATAFRADPKKYVK